MEPVEPMLAVPMPRQDATVAVQWQWWATVSTWQKRAALGKKAEDMTT